MDSTGKPTANASFDEVDEMLSDLNLRVAALQLGPTTGVKPAAAGVKTDQNTANDDITSNRDNTGIPSKEQGKTGENDEDLGDPPLPDFLAEHHVREALRRANSLHMQRHGNPAVFSPRFDPLLGGLQTDDSLPFWGGCGETFCP